MIDWPTQGRSISKYRNVRRKEDRYREKIILISGSNSKLRKYTIFMDNQIGISDAYQKQLVHVGTDEDNESSDQIVQYGIEKCIEILSNQKKSKLMSTSVSQEELDSKQTVKIRYERDGNRSIYIPIHATPQKEEI